MAKKVNVSNVPNLRFPGFEGEEHNPYKKYFFKDIFLFSTGRNIKQDQASPEFEIPCVRYGELYYMYSEVINEVINRTNLDKSELLFSKGDEVILPSAGEDPLDIGLASALTIKNVAIGRTINILRPIKPNIYSQIYVSYYINQQLRRKISTLAKGSSISNVYNSDLKTLEIILPNVDEQNKIVSFLLLLNERIQTQSKIIQRLKTLIKGIYHKTFRQEKYLFKSFSLGSLCTIKKGDQINNAELLDDGIFYVMNGGTSPSGYHSQYNREANVISISEGGNSCGYVQYNYNRFWSGGHCYTLHDIIGSIDHKYLYFYLKATQVDIMKLRVGSGLPNIQKKDLDSFKVFIPTYENQKNIATLFDTFYSKLIIEEKMVTELQKQKQYLLKNIFI